MFLTAKKVASLMGVHYNTVLRHIASGDLPATRFGKQWRIAESDLEVYQKKWSNQPWKTTK